MCSGPEEPKYDLSKVVKLQSIWRRYKALKKAEEIRSQWIVQEFSGKLNFT